MTLADTPHHPLQGFLDPNALVVDVRTPAEYLQGHIPGSHNLPLFSNGERAEVGTVYKHQGRLQAVQLGLALVGPKLSALASQLLDLYQRQEGRDSPLAIHCWRGGMRSASVAWLAQTLGLSTQVLDGGYKSFRHWVLNQMEKPWPLILLGGRTGTGKTDVLKELALAGAAMLDLEDLAHHRGSSFGGLGQPPQPSNEHYENRIAMVLQRCQGKGSIWIEAESAQVGSCRIPAGLWRQMGQAPVVEIHRCLEERVQKLVADYGNLGQAPLRQATERIARRLGPQRTALALAAIDQQDWPGACRQMLDYYDRCYDHDLQRRPQQPLRRFDLTGFSQSEAAQLLLQDQGVAEVRL